MVTDLTLNFFVGHHEDSGLEFQILNSNNVIFHSASLMSDTLTVTCKINLPCVIEFVISGRSELDTTVDNHGNIIKDKFIHFKNMIVDCFSIESWQIPKSCLLIDPNSGISENFFWNRNGSVKLIIDQDDPLIWILTHKTLVGIVE